MAEGLTLPDGAMPAAAVDVENGEADFARMMVAGAEGVSGPADNEPAAPPKRAADDEKPRRGRPTKATRARTRDAKPGDGKPGDKPKPITPHDFTGDLMAVGDGLWIGLSSIPFTAPYAAVVHANQANIVSAINAGAQVNPGVRNAVEKLTSGTGSALALQLAVVGANVAMTGWQIAKDPELRAQVVEANSKAVKSYMEQLGAVQVAEAE
jgi:hypothetical protein